MKRIFLIASLCALGQAGWAAEGDRPKPRPALCASSNSQQLTVCPMLFSATVRTESPAVRQIAPARATVTRSAPKMMRLPWMVGVYQ